MSRCYRVILCTPGFTKVAQASKADDGPVHTHQDGCKDMAEYAVGDQANAPNGVEDCFEDESNEDDSEDDFDEKYHSLISCFDDYKC